MADTQLQPAKPAAPLPAPVQQTQQTRFFRKYVPWRDRVKYYSWQWHGIVTATAVVSSVIHIWPYHNYRNGVKVVACIILIIALVVFVWNLCIKVAKIIMFPRDALTHLTDPGKSSFAGFLAVGGAGLIDAAVNVIRDWHPGAKNRFLFAMYAFWWIDAVIAWITAFGVIYFIMGQKSKDLGRVMAIWIIPCVAMVASSTCGGLLAGTLIEQGFPRLALVTTTFTITMGLVGLCFTTMITFGFIIRLLLHGTPDGMIALATFNLLTPLGQGGFSLLINGENLSQLVPYVTSGSDFPEIALAGKLLFSVCFCGAYVLWCMGIIWITLSLFVIFRRSKRLPNFGLAWWGAVFPNGTYALLTVQLGNVLQSRFYHGFGAAWSCVVMLLWLVLFLRSIPAFITGTMFLPQKSYFENRRAKKHRKHHHHAHPGADAEKGLPQPQQQEQQPAPAPEPERDDRSTLVGVDGTKHPEGAKSTARDSSGTLMHVPSSHGSGATTPVDRSGRATPVDATAPAHDQDISSAGLPVA
ncbi:uncharacterized protein PHACADRAFT_257945 [Phanerochaete carnosa HHB-10118-sp]|uniref:C4-dicarboxylate transporter/malic acid transport protein n=1 Tax=Phanerochaete carnosa (strain HHB-10118-sp) TaxID=650164 RepID=K5VRV8_PHACS|nr:uncharacterized protein PHACADRAFT_257945 [Phanerochaete carnosa HHB-10118-sp]EKM54238.1 hypothetical protein PHACADRAFT_257945 [Phanerochaete carnosa HHB-10118-sp]